MRRYATRRFWILAKSIGCLVPIANSAILLPLWMLFCLQIDYSTVFFFEYFGPMVIYPLFFFLPHIFYPGQP